MAPPRLAPGLHSLPPMLHRWCRRAMSGCSKGARGLFVLSRVLGILTETPISPSLWRRQRSSRYAIRAGRNLPDKEFRYLRTVIVTAAVYRGFDSELRGCPLTPPLNLPAPGRRQCLYVVLLDFADTCVFAKQSLEPILCGPLCLAPAKGAQLPRAPLLPKLRGHFAEFLLHSSLEHLRLLASPTCVRLRYGHKMHSPPRLFSAAGLDRLKEASPLSASALGYPGLLAPGTAYRVAPGRPSPGPAFTPASPLRVRRASCGSGMFTRFPSSTPFGLDLGSD
jgi:hypothetical protein